MFFRNYEFGETLLDKCRKSCTLKDQRINGIKECLNLNDITFTIFIYHSAEN